MIRIHPEIVVKTAFFPYLALQGAWLRRTALELPEPQGPRSGCAGQGPLIRVLITGDSSAAGVGTDSQDQALSGQILRRLAPDYQVQWKLLARTGDTTPQAIARLQDCPPERFDIAVTALGVNDITRGLSMQSWLRHQRKLFALLETKFGVRQIVASGLPPVHQFPLLPPLLKWILGRQARRYDAGLRGLIAEQRHWGYETLDLPLGPHNMASDGFHPGPIVYSEWGERVAKAVRGGPILKA